MFRAILLLLLLAMTGCASLKVNTSILNKDYWSSPQRLSEQVRQRILAMDRRISDGGFAQDRETTKQQVWDVLEAYKWGGETDITSRRKMEEDYSKMIDDAYLKAAEKFSEAMAELRKIPPGDVPLTKAEALYFEGTKALETLKGKLNMELRQSIEKAFADKKVDAEGKKEGEKALDSIRLSPLIGKYEILDDPHASAVIYAPDAFWKGHYNKTFAIGTFGDLDIAIKMEEIGQFTIKGVRNDTARVTQAAFAVVQQTVQTLGAFYGIPVSNNQTASHGFDGGVLRESGLPSPAAVIRGAGNEAHRLRQMRFHLAETILLHGEKGMLSDSDKREAVAKRILAVIQSQKTELKPPPK